MDQVNEKVNIMSILEIKGIKCSATSFQIEMEIKQMMILKPENLFEKCLFKTNSVVTLKNEDTVNEPNDFFNHIDTNDSIEDNTKQELVVSHNTDTIVVDTLNNNSNDNEVIIEDVNDSEEDSIKENEDNENIKEDSDKVELNTLDTDNNIKHPENTLEGLENKLTNNDLIEDKETEKSLVEDQKYLENHKEKEVNELQEVNLSLDEIPEQNSFSIKNKDNVYYQMYKEAKTKAKVARDLAISSYLESKRIKNLYMLDNTSDTDDSDFENIGEESENI
jgi:hypothetical protein